MKFISRKKLIYKVSARFADYLDRFDRSKPLPIVYEDLLRYDNAVALYDKAGDDTLWSTLSYSPGDRDEIEPALLQIYALLRAEGDLSNMGHLVVDRVDLCLFGNTKPFRVRIVNTMNDNFDYFYIKEADASRVFGLELEHILSPNRINFLVCGNTLIEEHIYGIPGDMFIEKYLGDENLNPVRLAKEFVKFNERCFIRLLGDMHAANFVIDITVDFEENLYRIRSIDFDQQSFESRKKVYLPQFYIQNNPFVELTSKYLSRESVRQYQMEERSMIHKRMKSSHYRLTELLKVMKVETLSRPENVTKLAAELADHYQRDEFLSCRHMGELIECSLATIT